MEKKITSDGFIFGVLMSLHHLQGIPQFHEGVSLRDLTTYVTANSITDGDVPHQIETALLHSLDLGYVRKVDNLYQSIATSAKIQEVPRGSLEQKQEITRIHDILSTNWLSGKSFQNYVQKERSIKILDNVKSDIPEKSEPIDAEANVVVNENIDISTNREITSSKKRCQPCSDNSSNSSRPISNSSSTRSKAKRRKRERKKRRKSTLN